MEYKLFNRELSWLSFNYRVLQEAKDTSVPLYERIKFLAIYSSKLDEFFRVRVASLRSLLDLKKKAKKRLDFDVSKLLEKIHRTVDAQQVEFGKIFREQIIPELNSNNIFIVKENEQLFGHTYLNYLHDAPPLLNVAATIAGIARKVNHTMPTIIIVYPLFVVLMPLKARVIAKAMGRL